MPKSGFVANTEPMKNIVFTLMLITLVVTSCTEKLDLDYVGKTSNKLVVYGGITNDTTAHTIELYQSIDYSNNSMPPAENAIVKISCPDKEFVLTEVEPGIYRTDSNAYGEIGKEYTLHIELENGEVYTGTDYLNTIATIDSIRMEFTSISMFDYTGHILYFFAQEPATPGNSYLWNLYLDDELYTDTLDKVLFDTDELYNGNYIADADLFWLDETDIVTDTVQITLEMLSISEGYYNFLLNVMLETAWRGGPFDATPANVPSNIEGALGYFYASAIERESIPYVVPDVPVEFDF